MDRFWRVSFATPSAIDAGYNDDIEFFFKELGKTYLALWQAWTVGRHVSRHYLDIFLDNCKHCRGTGIVICPHCNGYKTKKTRPAVFKLSLMTTVNNLYPQPDAYECFHCGGYTMWDHQHKWEMLTAVKEVEGEIASACFTGPEHKFTASSIDEDQQEGKFDAEHYISGTGDTDFAGWYTGDENGEVHPKRQHLSEWVYNHPEYYENGEQDEASEMINQNIAAAVADRPKPYMFEPAAGTVPCPRCYGEPWYWTLAPNLDKLGGYRLPFWYNTLQRMGHYHGEEQQPGPSNRRREYMEFSRTYDPPGLRGDMQPMLNHYAGPGGVQWATRKALEREERLSYWMNNFADIMKGLGPAEQQQFKAMVYQELAGSEDGLEAGESDPLSMDPAKVLDTEELANVEYSRHPLTGVPPIFYKWLFGPATPRQEASKLRDIRAVRAAKGNAERMELLRQLQPKWQWQGELDSPLEDHVHSADVLGGRQALGRFTIRPEPLHDPELAAAGQLRRGD